MFRRTYKVTAPVHLGREFGRLLPTFLYRSDGVLNIAGASSADSALVVGEP